MLNDIDKIGTGLKAVAEELEHFTGGSDARQGAVEELRRTIEQSSAEITTALERIARGIERLADAKDGSAGGE